MNPIPISITIQIANKSESTSKQCSQNKTIHFIDKMAQRLATSTILNYL